MAPIPIGRIRSWTCLACGMCCRVFRVALTPYEYAKLSTIFGPWCVDVDEFGNPCLRKVGGRCVFQTEEGLCGLQPLGLKPLACKVWPFRVLKRPKYGHPQEALFVYGGKRYYVYVNSMCSGVNRGDPRKLPLVVSEVIRILKRPSTPQRYSTSNIALRPLLTSSRSLSVSILSSLRSSTML